jgi:hypothetical protein
VPQDSWETAGVKKNIRHNVVRRTKKAGRKNILLNMGFILTKTIIF